MNRFWSNIEGYHGPLLFLVSATSGDLHGDATSNRKWIIGALTQQGFENRDTFYGSSGSLYAISPTFHVFPPSGKCLRVKYRAQREKNGACRSHPPLKRKFFFFVGGGVWAFPFSQLMSQNEIHKMVPIS